VANGTFEHSHRSARCRPPGERREARLAKLAGARAKERFDQEMAEYHAKLAAREEKAAATGKKPGGRPSAPAVEGPQPKSDQSDR
jgi:hypothetical protein